METTRIITLFISLILSATLTFAESTSNHGDHSAMSTEGLMYLLGSSVNKGVKASAHIKDVSKAMAEHGMEATHHFMIAFFDEKTGEQLEEGTVALKTTNPDAKVGDAIQLVGMDGHFGVDVVLDMQGEYHFKLGTQLADGQKRKFHFHFKNE